MPLDEALGDGNSALRDSLLQQYQQDAPTFSGDAAVLTERLSRKLAPIGQQPSFQPTDFSEPPEAPEAKEGPDLSSYGTPVEPTPEPSSDDLSSFGTPVAAAAAPEAPEPSLGVTGQLKAAGKGLLRGAPEHAGGILQGVATATKTRPISPEGVGLIDELANAGAMSASERAKLMGRALRTIGDRGKQMEFNAALQRIARGGDAAAESAKLRESFGAQNTEAAKPASEMPLYKAGTALKTGVDAAVPMTDQEKSSIGGRVGTMTSGILPYAAATVLAGPAAGIAAGFTGMAADTFGSVYDSATKAGKTDDEARASATKAALAAGVLGSLPLGAGKYASSLIAKMAVSSVAFATAGEATEAILQQIAKDYDPKAGYSLDQKRLIAELILGAGMGGLHHAFEDRAQPAQPNAPQPGAGALPPGGGPQPGPQAGPQARTGAGTPPPGGGAGPNPGAGPQGGPNPGAGGAGPQPGAQPGPQPGAKPGAPPPGTGAGKGAGYTMDPKVRAKMERVYRMYEPSGDPSKMSDADLFNAVNEHLRDTSKTGYTAKPETPEEAAAREGAATERTEREALKRRGWTDAHINAMTPEQRRKYFQDAMAGEQTPPPNASAGGTPEEPPAATSKSDVEEPVAGKREAPIVAETVDDVLKASEVVKEPTPAQAKAGNYQHGHLELPHLGLDGKNGVSIETGVGQTRKGTSPDGTAWEVRMPVAYGKIKGTVGADGDHLDVFIGPKPTSPHVFIIDQRDPATDKFDEHKVLVGFDHPREAVRAYKDSYSDNAIPRIGAVRAIGPDEFKEWLANGDHTQRFSSKNEPTPSGGSEAGSSGASEADAQEMGGKTEQPQDRSKSNIAGPSRRTESQDREEKVRSATQEVDADQDYRSFPGDVKARAAAIMADENRPLDDAVEQAALRTIHEDADHGITPQLMRDTYGEGVHDEIQAKAASGNGGNAEPERKEEGDDRADQEAQGHGKHVPDHGAARGEAEVNADHHQAIEDVLGADADHVQPVDIARAAELLAEHPDMPPEIAFQHAVIENAVNQGDLTPEQAEEAYGPEVKAILGAGSEGASGSGAHPEQSSTEPVKKLSGGGEETGVVQGRGKAGGTEAAEGAEAGDGKVDIEPDTGRAKPNAERKAAGSAEPETAAGEGRPASRLMEDALDKIEEAVEDGNRNAVLAAGRAARKVLADTSLVEKKADPEYWKQFDSVIRKMVKPGYVTAKQQELDKTGLWWKNELTKTGREEALKNAGMPIGMAKMSWHYINTPDKEKLHNVHSAPDGHPLAVKSEAPSGTESKYVSDDGPWFFPVRPDRPLLILSCSETKTPLKKNEFTRFINLYDGPLWQQVKSADYPVESVTAISALYGFLDPGQKVETYDRKMDEDASKRISSISNDVERIADAIRVAGSAYVVGGGLYRAPVETAIRRHPDLKPMVTFATGSFLQMRKQLGEWLRSNANEPVPSGTPMAAGDSDETVHVTLSRKGPWDFNDTWPAPDPKAVKELDKEGRNPLHDGDDPQSIVEMLDEGLNGLMSDIAEVRGIDERVKDIRNGTTKLKRKQTIEDAVKPLLADRVRYGRAVLDTQESYREIFGREAADAMVKEAKRRLVQEEHSSPGEKVRPTESAERDAPTWAEILAELPMHKDGRTREHELAFRYMKERFGETAYQNLSPAQKHELLDHFKPNEEVDTGERDNAWALRQRDKSGEPADDNVTKALELADQLNAVGSDAYADGIRSIVALGHKITAATLDRYGSHLAEKQKEPNISPSEESEHGVPSSVSGRDAGPEPEDVPSLEEGGGTGEVRGAEGGRGAPAVPGDHPERAEAAERGTDDAGSEGSGGGSQGDDVRVPGRHADELAGREERADQRDARAVVGENYHIEPGSTGEDRSPRAKAVDNVQAIKLANRLIAEDRPATAAEQHQLARYVGWGGIKGAFPDADGEFGKGFEQVGADLKATLTPEEYDTARRSIQYAHYTAETIISRMWGIAQQLGFAGGAVFEPGMGVGHFAGLMPPDVAERSSYQGVELDHVTARIAKLLYPKWGVRREDFTRMPVPDNTFDLAIGNPPFADIAIQSDPKYPQGFLLHDYFFAKSLDAVRPGGVLMFVTSAGTMNKIDTKARDYLADRADFIGAVRLPSNAFKQNAGTEVTTDIVMLRKRMPGETAGDRSWTQTAEVSLPGPDGKPITGQINRYFAEHPEMVLGQGDFADKLYKGRYSVKAPKGFDLDAALAEAAAKLPSNVMLGAETPTERAEVDFDHAEHKHGSYYVDKDGSLRQMQSGGGVLVAKRGKGIEGGKSAEQIERIRGLVPIRDALRETYAADLADDKPAGDRARKKLNAAYDAFVGKFGPINKAEIQLRRPSIVQQEGARAEAREEARYAGLPFDEGTFDPTKLFDANRPLAEIARKRKEAREKIIAEGGKFSEGSFDPEDMKDNILDKRPNIEPFMDDQEAYRLRAIEHYDDTTGKAAKGLVFSQNVITRDQPPKIGSINDAALYVLNQKGALDLDAIGALAGKSKSEAIEALGDRIYRVPGTRDTWETKEAYLAGNVRKKLALAKAEAARDASLRRNVEALEAAQPAPLAPAQIYAGLGMPWIPEKVINDFATQELGLESFKAKYIPVLAQWTVQGDDHSVAAITTWGTSRRNATQLISDALNHITPKIYDEGADNKRILNVPDTQSAQDKLTEIKEKFKGWIFADDARADPLAAFYNENYNNLVVRQYDGSYLTTPGIATGWKWRPHQTRVVARIIQDGNTYMAHAVGAGKTSAMIGAGMEMRRLGLVKKPMYAVPNHMLAQFTKEFYEQYPTARIAVADDRNFHADRRKQFMANVALDDLDAVIITHTNFGMIPVSDAFNDEMIETELDRYRNALSEVTGQGARITRSRIEKQIERLEQRLSGKSTRRKDAVFTFDEMGTDFLFVDEAQEFRKLDFSTQMSNLKGITPEGSGKAWDLYVKTKLLEKRNPGRNLVLASGTPVTNTMAELYTVSRYLQPAELAERHLSAFDAWAGAFGEEVSELEQDAAGGYKPVARFAKFINVAELSAMVRQVMDVVTSRQLEQYVTRPKIEGGKRKMHLADKSPALIEYQDQLALRMKLIKQRGKPQPGDDIMLTVIGDGRHAAIDMRLVGGDSDPDYPSKLEMLIDNVHKTIKETAKTKFYRPRDGGFDMSAPVDIGPATQMVFSNLGISAKRGLPVHDYIRAELVRRGVPRDKIALISDFKTHIAKQKLFNDMNAGKVLVMIGSTAKMGTGVNAQRRLKAIHNLDPLWYPSDDEQRNGRGIRQGNWNPEIGINDYSTKGTYDSTMWGLMEKKARFIQGFFEGDPSMREMDDLGEASQYAQAKAMTTNDPRLMKLVEIKQDLERAMRRKDAFESERYALKRRQAEARSNLDHYGTREVAIKQDLRQREDMSGDKFKGIVGKETFDKRVDFGGALLDQLEKVITKDNAGRTMVVGEISGFPIRVRIQRIGNLKNADLGADLLLKRSGEAESTIHGTSALGIARSIETILSGFDSDLEHAQGKVATAEKFLKESQGKEVARFQGEQEIEKLSKEVRDLEAELSRKDDEKLPPVNPDGTEPPPPAGSITLGAFGDPAKVAEAFKEFWTSTFQPELVSDRALMADPLFGRYKSAQAQEKDALIKQSESEWNYWNKRSDAERIRFLDDVETAVFGSVPSDPIQAAMARRYRRMLDANWALEKRYGSQAAFVEDYFPHIWKKPDAWRAFAQARSAQMGPTWFQKKRTIDYITDGLAAGLELHYTNPVDIIVHRLSSGVDMRQRMELLYQLKDQGLAWEGVQGGAQLVRRGWVAINAPDRKQWVIHPDAQLLWKNGVEAKGLWQAEHVGGSMFRGWMALKNAWIPVKLALSAFHPLHVLHINYSNGMALGWDQLTKGHDVMGALQSVAGGFGGPLVAAPGASMGAAVGALLGASVGAPVWGGIAGSIAGAATYGGLRRAGIVGQPAHLGKQAREAWATRPQNWTPEQRAMVELMNDGGFVPQLSQEMKIAAKRKLAVAFQEALRDKTNPVPWLRAAWHSMRRAIEVMQAPIFEQWIPSLKAAAYLNQAAALLKRRPELLTYHNDRRMALRAIAKSIDNRFGEMFYGNLFWNRYLKDAAIGSFLSIGWNLGFVREFGGAAFEAISRPAGLFPPLRPGADRATIRNATNKIAFAIAYMASSALILGLMSMLMDDEHKTPEGLDWIFPRIGGVNPDGTPRRITNMSYIREVPMLVKHIQERGGNVLTGTAEMIYNKMLFEPFNELLNNRTYYGYNIWDENVPVYKQVWQGLKHTFGDETNPMAISGAKHAAQLSGKEFPSAREAIEHPSKLLDALMAKGVDMSMLGFGPAPAYVEKSGIQNRISYLYQHHVAPGSRPQADEENSQEKMAIRSAIMIAKRDKDSEMMALARERGRAIGLSPKYMADLGKTPTDVYLFSRLPADDQKSILMQASPEERERYIKHANQKVRIEINRQLYAPPQAESHL